MDLLANYGSDEEDEEPAVPSSSGNKLVFALPPPRASAQAVRVVDEPVKVKRSPSVGPKAELPPLPSDFFGSSSVGARAEPSTLPSGLFDEASKVDHEETSPVVSGKPSSLFSKLPPPSSFTRLSLANLPPPSNSKSKTKTVEFKPPVDLSVLESTDENEDERRKKRSKITEASEAGSGAKVGGLAGLLPPPKNSLGSGLAFGGAGGRRTAMETASVSSETSTDVIVPKRSTGRNEGDNASRQAAGSSSETLMRVNPNAQYHYSAQPGQGHTAPTLSYSGPEVRKPEGNYAQEQYSADSDYQNYSADGGYSNWQVPDAYGVAAEPSSANTVTDPVAEVLQRERRKGRNEPPPQFIEVKQADLTAGRVREDQLRTTGIAFGPNYQPVSSGKDKPSKIHRRKHQIGALYFDMKSKEMELLDRRSKGNLTKAETQAKYGW